MARTRTSWAWWSTTSATRAATTTGWPALKLPATGRRASPNSVRPEGDEARARGLVLRVARERGVDAKLTARQGAQRTPERAAVDLRQRGANLLPGVSVALLDDQPDLAARDRG